MRVRPYLLRSDYAFVNALREVLGMDPLLTEGMRRARRIQECARRQRMTQSAPSPTAMPPAAYAAQGE